MSASRNSNKSGRKAKIWIDLDNSPHVPFFAPIIEELEKRGYSTFLTARDCFQVCDLADLYRLSYKRVGRHYGKNKILKIAGLCVRGLQLLLIILREKPDLALSHGSRGLLLASAIASVPCVTIFDYEFTKGSIFSNSRNWVMAPEVIPDAAIRCDKDRILRYPGIKEDVYVPRFQADPSLHALLGINGEELVVTLRPPADEAHYHNPQSDELFRAAVELLSHKPNLKMVLLPRNHKQAIAMSQAWPRLFASGKMVIPQHVVDGLNLIWNSDVVISGGGTMNREAAALHVPVYSVFRGKIGAVDQYLSNTGRLVLLETVADVNTKIALTRRGHPAEVTNGSSNALRTIVNHVEAILDWPDRRQNA